MLGRRQRQRGADEARRDLVLPAAVGLMAGLADVPVDLAARVEALLFLRRQRRRRPLAPGLPGHVDAREHRGRARRQIVRRRGGSAVNAGGSRSARSAVPGVARA